MSQTRIWMAAICAVTLMAGCASGDQTPRSEASANRQCFFASSVNSFASVDSNAVNIRVGANQVFRLDLMSNCGRDVTWTRSTRLVTRGSSSICTGSGIGTTLVIRGPTGRDQRCAVSSITALTPEEVQALPARARP